MTKADTELLAKARAGDRAAVDELLRRYELPIYRFGLRMCGNQEDAKDVLQETLVSAFKGLPEFRGDAEISTWLYQVARSFCIKSRRRRVGEPRETASLDAREVATVSASGESPDDQAHARQVGAILQAAILALPESYREVVILKDVEGLSAEEAASVLGEQVAAVKSRLHRARLELRGNLTTLMGADAPAGGAPAGPCPELAEELADYAAGDIDQATCVSIEQHLKGCSRCAGACESLKRSVSLCRQIPGNEVPAPIRAAVRQALLRIR